MHQAFKSQRAQYTEENGSSLSLKITPLPEPEEEEKNQKETQTSNSDIKHKQADDSTDFTHSDDAASYTYYIKVPVIHRNKVTRLSIRCYVCKKTKKDTYVSNKNIEENISNCYQWLPLESEIMGNFLFFSLSVFSLTNIQLSCTSKNFILKKNWFRELEGACPFPL